MSRPILRMLTCHVDGAAHLRSRAPGDGFLQLPQAAAGEWANRSIRPYVRCAHSGAILFFFFQNVVPELLEQFQPLSCICSPSARLASGSVQSVMSGA